MRLLTRPFLYSRLGNGHLTYQLSRTLMARPAFDRLVKEVHWQLSVEFKMLPTVADNSDSDSESDAEDL